MASIIVSHDSNQSKYGHILTCILCAGDIKDENIVVDKNFRVKLIDFGSAIFYDTRMPPPFHMRFYGVSFRRAEWCTVD